MVSTDVVAPVIDTERTIGVAKREPESPPEISNWQLAIYALPSIPIAFLFLPVAMLLPAYYASEMHVSLTAIGGFLVVSRLADVLLDPMIGRWSDMSRSRLGRRKFWMVLGTPILMIGAFILMMPMIPVTGLYLLVASFVIYAGGSTVGLPYAAWGTEIAETYHGRSRMAGFREGAGVIGGLMAAAIPAATGYFGHGVDRFTMSIMGWMIIVLTPLTVFIAARYVAEPPMRERVNVPWWPSLTALFGNKPFRLFCMSYIIYWIGGSVAASTMVFYTSDYLGAKSVFGTGLLLLAISQILFVPSWLWVSRRIGKHNAVVVSLLISMALYGGVTPFLKPGQGVAYIVLLVVLGAASCGLITLPVGMIGDIIDYDTLKHGQPRGGIFWGVWSFAQKVSPALGIGITLPLLKLLNFNPGSHNTQGALEALKYVYCFGPVPFYITGGLLLLYFPINARRHAIIRKRLDQREERRERRSSSP